MYHYLLKPLLFKMDPENAHHLTMKLFGLLLKLPGGKSVVKSLYGAPQNGNGIDIMGLHFPNKVGLAAGFDKDGKYMDLMAHLGFGFLEIGTVTPRPQGGNPKPRLFRLPADKALINRMGFNNDGVDALVKRLQKHKPQGIIVGGNIGKNKDTPNDRAVEDYEICFEKLYDLVDYFVVNVSSPNTPGLRELQDKEPLLHLLSHLQLANSKKPSPKPILLKIAPDLTDAQLDDIIDIVKASKIAGVIATNTTIERSGLYTPSTLIDSVGAGGLSGYPVRHRSTAVIRYLHTKSGGAFPIIGVGGVDSPEAAKEKLNAGASLVQVYSGMVYYGPSLVKDVVKGLCQ